MLIHPWDAALDDNEWQGWLSAHDFGELCVNGLPGSGPFVQPLHFFYDPESHEALAHLARPNPIWTAIDADPHVTLSVVGDQVYVPTYWTAEEGAHPDHGTATSYYAAVQLSCVAHVIDDKELKAQLLNRQLAHFQPEGRHADVAPGEAPYGRLLPGIRALRLEVTEVRAKFKFAGNKNEAVQGSVVRGLNERAGTNDTIAADHVVRRGRASRT
jgi:transcriptional regulator